MFHSSFELIAEKLLRHQLWCNRRECSQPLQPRCLLQHLHLQARRTSPSRTARTKRSQTQSRPWPLQHQPIRCRMWKLLSSLMLGQPLKRMVTIGRCRRREWTMVLLWYHQHLRTFRHPRQASSAHRTRGSRRNPQHRPRGRSAPRRNRGHGRCSTSPSDAGCGSFSVH